MDDINRFMHPPGEGGPLTDWKSELEGRVPYSVEKRDPRYINHKKPEEWGVFVRGSRGRGSDTRSIRYRGTKEECEAKKEEWELVAARKIMAAGTGAEKLLHIDNLTMQEGAIWDRKE